MKHTYLGTLDTGKLAIFTHFMDTGTPMGYLLEPVEEAIYKGLPFSEFLDRADDAIPDHEPYRRLEVRALAQEMYETLEFPDQDRFGADQWERFKVMAGIPLSTTFDCTAKGKVFRNYFEWEYLAEPVLWASILQSLTKGTKTNDRHLSLVSIHS